MQYPVEETQAARIAELEAENARLREENGRFRVALRQMTDRALYHLSTCELDGARIEEGVRFINETGAAVLYGGSWKELPQTCHNTAPFHQNSSDEYITFTTFTDGKPDGE